MCHWVLIETGANQAYIFDTNRLRHVVGASYLVHALGTEWVAQAIEAHDVRVVQAISGKALLLVADPDVGRAVISDVSGRALVEAPGLDVTGVVGPGFDPELDWQADQGSDGGSDSATETAVRRPLTHVEALRETYDLLEAVREARLPVQLRDPVLPWFEICRESGLPAAGVERHSDGGSVAAAVLAKSKVRDQAGARMRELLRAVPEVVPHDLDDLRDDGWVAVIHADGNGVGRVFTQFAEHALRVDRESAGLGTDHGDRGRDRGLSLDRHAALLHDFTTELESATETALDLAVRDATAGEDASDSILPVVVGGDDLTLVCHARFALAFVRAFTAAFEDQTARRPTILAIAGSGLTAAAGIAYVKPHHPFSAAYGLAEELTAAAKEVARTGEREVSAVDLHVAFESTIADLAELRSRMSAGGIPRHGGPYLLTAQDEPSAGPRDIAELDRTRRTAEKLSSSLAHDLREGLAACPEEYELRIRRAMSSQVLPAGVRPDDIEHLRPTPVVRLLDALLLDAIEGTRKEGVPA